MTFDPPPGGADPSEIDTGVNPQRTLYCHWDSHNVEVPFVTENELNQHMRSHFAEQAPRSQPSQVACHWDACHEVVEFDDFMGHFNSLHAHQSFMPHTEEFEGHPLHFQCTRPPIKPPQAQPGTPYVRVHTLEGAAPQVMNIAAPPLSSLPLAAPVKPAACTCEWVLDNKHGSQYVCGLDFASSQELNQHLVSVHIGSGQAEYRCRWSGCYRESRPFKQRQKAIRHLQVHARNLTLKCQICARMFCDEVALRQHLRTHSGEKPHVCKVCQKGFAAATALSIHMRTHTGEKPLKCRIQGCTKRFAESSNLAKHMKTHFEKAHECPRCGRRFARQDQLSRHSQRCVSTRVAAPTLDLRAGS